MTRTIDIITRNFFLMMRSGALNEYVELEPMSAFKWRRLADVAISQNVASVALRAVKNMQYEPAFNMPPELRDYIQAEAAKQTGQTILAEMDNPILNRKLAMIHALERHSRDCSADTLNCFDIIIANCRAMLCGGTSMRLIIRLGNYIRINAPQIDFAKVNGWLRELQMQRMAQLVGSVLIINFAFRREELPFVVKVDTMAANAMTQSIMDRRKEKNRRGVTYFEYAPMENASIILRRLKSRLDTIEE